jgi:hypothetical protein
MKEIKFLLKQLLTVIWTSSWWAFIILYKYNEVNEAPVIGLKAVFVLSSTISLMGTVALLLLAIAYIVDHWKEE